MKRPPTNQRTEFDNSYKYPAARVPNDSYHHSCIDYIAAQLQSASQGVVFRLEEEAAAFSTLPVHARVYMVAAAQWDLRQQLITNETAMLMCQLWPRAHQFAAAAR